MKREWSDQKNWYIRKWEMEGGRFSMYEKPNNNLLCQSGTYIYTCTASVATDRAIGRHFCAHTCMCTGLKLVVLYVHVLKCVIHVVLHKLHACCTSLALLSKVKELWLHVLCILYIYHHAHRHHGTVTAHAELISVQWLATQAACKFVYIYTLLVHAQNNNQC